MFLVTVEDHATGGFMELSFSNLPDAFGFIDYSFKGKVDSVEIKQVPTYMAKKIEEEI